MNADDGRKRRRWGSRLGRALLVGSGLLTLSVFTAGATADRWLFVVLDPGPFDPVATPPPPNYEDPSSWAALPNQDDSSDVALPSHPAIDPSQTEADVFYVHPTTAVGSAWNAPFDTPQIMEATSRRTGGTRPSGQGSRAGIPPVFGSPSTLSRLALSLYIVT